MSDVVERAKAALDGVTEGPWEMELVDGQPVEHEYFHYDSMDEWYDVDGPNGGWLAHCQDIPDARFIAASRDLVPELVAEVERLQAGHTRYVHPPNDGCDIASHYYVDACSCPGFKDAAHGGTQ